jgi:ATP-dependent Clp protease ATP-binding subunit ClpB
MNGNKFTEKAHDALVAAETLAGSENNSQVEDLHLLAALVEQSDGVAGAVLTKLHIDLTHLRAVVREALSRLPKSYGSNVQPYASSALRAILQRALSEAVRL